MSMTVRELINELIEYDMDSYVELRLKLANMDVEYEKFDVECERSGGGWGTKTVYISIDKEDKTSEEFAESELHVNL